MDRRSVEWAKSGAMALTGRADGPALGAPGALVDLVERAATVFNARSGRPIIADGLALLGERAVHGNLSRQGAVSCGGSTRLVPAADGWLAVSLARPDDIAALPAWLQGDLPSVDPWPALTELVARRPASLLDQRAGLLGLPIARLASVSAPDEAAFGLPITAVRLDDTDGTGHSTLAVAGATVIDLSALWAGPLCGQLLAEAGATVIKVESAERPDGARRGPPDFFNLLNGAKRSVVVDLRSGEGIAGLRHLLATADVVIESARPRALEQLGLSAFDILRQTTGPRVWASITSHGRRPEARERVGFGDVAAVAGGLVAWDGRGPCFVADAVTDPVVGLVTAAAVSEALAAGGRWLLDAAMAPLAASMAGELLDVSGVAAGAPRSRPVIRSAPALGSDTADLGAAGEQ
jgi:hypothetical protein